MAKIVDKFTENLNRDTDDLIGFFHSQKGALVGGVLLLACGAAAVFTIVNLIIDAVSG